MMTEPDLVTIGDMSSIDNASLVAHINSKGVFDLNTLTVGRGCVLRRNTRLLSGAAMEDFSTMLEHTIVVSGDVLGAGTTWQGWPAQMLSAGKNAPSMGKSAQIPIKREDDVYKAHSEPEGPLVSIKVIE